MSYEIYYDKRFIKIGELICPVVQSGANNCWEISYPRDIPEKSWRVMNYPKLGQILFEPEELEDLYKNTEIYQEKHHKSRYKNHDDFSRWLIAGIKNAMTIAEHSELNNTLLISGWRTQNEKDEYISEIFKDEEEFHILYDLFQTDGVKNINVGFMSRDINKPHRKRNPKKHIKWSELDEYFVIKNKDEYPRYLCRLLKHGYRYTNYAGSSSVKKFKEQKDAQKYLEKYWNRLSDFCVKRIENKREDEAVEEMGA